MVVVAEVPEAFENNLSEVLEFRAKKLSKFSTLGPPDLCHLVKVQEKPPSILRSAPPAPSLIGSYHHIYGLDCKNPAEISAYFNSVVNDFSRNPAHHHHSKAVWKVQSCTFCAYNSFSGLDVRVEITFPGTVNSFLLDQDGQKYSCDDRIWTEIHISSALRYLNRPSEFETHIDVLRTRALFSTQDGRDSFLKSAREIFWEGKYLGTSCSASPVNNLNNYLTMGVKHVFFQSCCYVQCIQFFAEFAEKDVDLNSIIAECYHRLDRTGKGTALLATICLKSPELPHSAPLLLTQSRLLKELGDYDNALKIAKMVVEISPATADSWINLATMYIYKKEYGMALIALNVTPMSHGTDFQMLDYPEPNLIKNNNETLRDMIDEEEQGDTTLLSLPANGLKGTFRGAYKVLILLLQEITWDQMLQVRSEVFLMAEEYRSLANEDKDDDNDDTGVKEKTDNDDDSVSKADPSTSTETTSNAETTPNAETITTSTAASASITTAETDSKSPTEKIAPSVSGGEEDVTSKAPPKGGKRLLERWLDQLFTALYQDLMYSVIWNAQRKHQDNSPYNGMQSVDNSGRSPGDFYRYSQLAKRLNRKHLSFTTLQNCVATSVFCLRAHLALLDAYSEDGFVEESLIIIDSVEKFYAQNPELCPPLDLSNAVFRLISKHGLSMFCQLGGHWTFDSKIVRNCIADSEKWKSNGYNK